MTLWETSDSQPVELVGRAVEDLVVALEGIRETLEGIHHALKTHPAPSVPGPWNQLGEGDPS